MSGADSVNDRGGAGRKRVVTFSSSLTEDAQPQKPPSPLDAPNKDDITKAQIKALLLKPEDNESEHARRQLKRIQSDASASASATTVAKDQNNQKHKFALAWLTLTAFLVRCYNLNVPSDVIFDEMHFVNYVTYYIKGQYFFDILPPMGKLVFAWIAKCVDYDGSFIALNIGHDYNAARFPYIALRCLSAYAGSLMVPLMFCTLIEAGVHKWPALIASCFLLFDNASIVQSRLVMPDVLFHLMIMATAYVWIKLRQRQNDSHSWRPTFWLMTMGVLLGCSISTKLSGLYMWILVGMLDTVRLFKSSLYSKRLLSKQWRNQMGMRIFSLLMLPLTVYIGVHYIHLSLLTESGPADRYMSPDFQLSLHGNNNFLENRLVYYGSRVTIKSKVEDIYLHSHPFHYPTRHDDGKVSSSEQQVTGYPGTTMHDPNNEWIFELPFESVEFSEQGAVSSHEPKTGMTPVSDGDVVRLKHATTEKFLLAHDVASPLTRTHMEIATVSHADCLNRYYNHTLWRVELIPNPKEPNLVRGPEDPYNGPNLVSHLIHFRLVHMATEVALSNYQQNLPSTWGFGQREINGAKSDVGLQTHWVVDDVLWSHGSEAGNPAQLKTHSKPIPMSFVSKFIEHQILFFHANMAFQGSHPYASPSWSWPWMMRGISMWDDFNTKRQIYQLGNPFVWGIALLSLFIFAALLYKSLKERRPDESTSMIRNVGGFFFLGYLFLYVPSLLGLGTGGNMVFLNHYLPCLNFKLMIFAVVLHYYHVKMRNRGYTSGHFKALGGCLLLGAIVNFVYWAPLTFALPMSTAEGMARQWLPTWHYLVTLHPSPSV